MAEIIPILLVVLIIFVLGLIIGMGIQKRSTEKEILNKENVVECFKGVDWNTQTFMIGNEFMKTDDGTIQFYKAPPIKEAIKKLNELLDSN
mgnify:CR=1 FL=1